MVDDVWHVITTIAKKSWGAVSAVTALVTLALTLFYHNYLKDKDIPDWAKEYIWPITLVFCVLLFSLLMLGATLVKAWRRKGRHIRVDKRELAVYDTHAYRAGRDLEQLSAFAHKAFKGDTMKAEIVQHAVQTGAAAGLRLTDAAGNNVGFADVFHFTDEAMEKWKNGDLAEDALRKSNFRKIPAKGETLDLAFGGIYVDPAADRGLAIHFANCAQQFLRERFAKFRQVNIYATIFSDEGEILAAYCGFDIALKAKKRGPHANGHDLRLLTIDPKRAWDPINAVGGRRHIVIRKGH
jgi:hypothetical protein